MTAADGEGALRALAQAQPDVVVLDVLMPGLNGLDVCRQIKANPATRMTPVILVTGLDDRAHRLEGIDAGADDYLSKPVDPAELIARVRSLARLRRLTDQLESAESVIVSLALTIEARDPYTVGHCARLARYAAALGAEAGLGSDEIETLERGGVLHDIGKIGVPDALLLKPGPLTRRERARMERHTLIGDRLCAQLASLRQVRPVVRHHHERLDGSGYPDRLRGDQVPLLAQIIGIVDVYDALTTTRPYRPALTDEAARAELLAEARRGWRRMDLVEAFVERVQGRPVMRRPVRWLRRSLWRRPRPDVGVNRAG